MASFSEITKQSKRYFDGNLVALVLFGSRSRGDFSRDSDADLLVVVKKTEGLDIDRFARDFFWESKIRASPLVMTREEAVESRDGLNPLFLGILTSFKILYDTDDFAGKLLREANKNYAGVRFVDGVKTWNFPIQLGGLQGAI